MVTVELRWEIFVYYLEKIFNFVECLGMFIMKYLGEYTAKNNENQNAMKYNFNCKNML